MAGIAVDAVMPAADVPATAESVPQAAGGAGPVATIGMLLQGGTVGVFGWAVRRWLRQAGQRAAAKWWTVYPAVAVVFALAMAASLALSSQALPPPSGPPPSGDVTPEMVVSLVVSVVLGLLGVANAVVHIGACVAGIRAFRRLR